MLQSTKEAPNFLELRHGEVRKITSVLKNSPGARFRVKADTKRTRFGALGARFVVAISSTPTFSTGCHLLSTPVNKDKRKG